MKKLPNTYCFPAIFTYEEGYQIAVTFPDLPGCATCGENEAEAFAMGKEALGGHLLCMEKDGDEIPTPTPLKDVVLEENEVTTLIEVFMPSLRLEAPNKSMNRTVSLPAWLNAKALEKGINFSQLLQQSIKDMLDE